VVGCERTPCLSVSQAARAVLEECDWRSLKSRRGRARSIVQKGKFSEGMPILVSTLNSVDCPRLADRRCPSVHPRGFSTTIGHTCYLVAQVLNCSLHAAHTGRCAQCLVYKHQAGKHRHVRHCSTFRLDLKRPSTGRSFGPSSFFFGGIAHQTYVRADSATRLQARRAGRPVVPCGAMQPHCRTCCLAFSTAPTSLRSLKDWRGEGGCRHCRRLPLLAAPCRVQMMLISLWLCTVPKQRAKREAHEKRPGAGAINYFFADW